MNQQDVSHLPTHTWFLGGGKLQVFAVFSALGGAIACASAPEQAPATPTTPAPSTGANNQAPSTRGNIIQTSIAPTSIFGQLSTSELATLCTDVNAPVYRLLSSPQPVEPDLGCLTNAALETSSEQACEQLYASCMSEYEPDPFDDDEDFYECDDLARAATLRGGQCDSVTVGDVTACFSQLIGAMEPGLAEARTMTCRDAARTSGDNPLNGVYRASTEAELQPACVTLDTKCPGFVDEML